ncbi:MAG: hypothetical protein FWH17_00315 [Oscillospiraceae bacterium]|nr:hypothetical protein [Oscillospiraceae bacterium]
MQSERRPYTDISGRIWLIAAVWFRRRIPIDVTWVDGRVYEIDRVLDVRRAASLKGGGLGLRYKCRIDGRETFMWLDSYSWFVEAKQDMSD